MGSTPELHEAKINVVGLRRLDGGVDELLDGGLRRVDHAGVEPELEQEKFRSDAE